MFWVTSLTRIDSFKTILVDCRSTTAIRCNSTNVFSHKINKIRTSSTFKNNSDFTIIKHSSVLINQKIVFAFSLCSFLLTMTAVICWSRKTSMTAKMAGRILNGINHQWVTAPGLTNHPLHTADINYCNVNVRRLLTI